MVIQRQTYINLSDFPKKRDSEGRLMCLNCGKILMGRQEKYCSGSCSNEWLCKHSHQAMRSKLIRERKGICQSCGLQPKRVLSENFYGKGYLEERYIGKILRKEKNKYGSYDFTIDQLDDSQLILDHIIPIALGGDEFNEKNLQILCKKCDKIKTKQDHKDITKLRRNEKILSNGQKQIKDV